MFAITRQILREAGPDVGISSASVGGIAIAVLNRGSRPFLSKWHPLLQTWEAQKPPTTSAKDHEKNWSLEPQMRQELLLLAKDLEQYADALAEIVGVEE